MFKFSNIKEAKTTITGILVALLVIAKYIWPDKASDITEEDVTNWTSAIFEGIAALAAVAVLIFGSKDG